MSTIEQLLITYGPLIVFFWTLFEGETVVVVAGYLVHQGLLAPIPVAVAAFLGSVLSDQAVFFMGRHRIGSRYVFLHGFPKSDKANITQDEKKALQFAGKVFLELSAEALSKALHSGVLLEVHCEQDH